MSTASGLKVPLTLSLVPSTERTGLLATGRKAKFSGSRFREKRIVKAMYSTLVMPKMSLGERCDEIIRLIDEAIENPAAVSRTARSTPEPQFVARRSGPQVAHWLPRPGSS